MTKIASKLLPDKLRCYFGQNDVFVKSFRFLLTFRKSNGLNFSSTKLHHDLMFNLISRNPITNVTYDTLADRLKADTKKKTMKRETFDEFQQIVFEV